MHETDIEGQKDRLTDRRVMTSLFGQPGPNRKTDAVQQLKIDAALKQTEVGRQTDTQTNTQPKRKNEMTPN